MNTIEIVSPTTRGHLPRTDSPKELVQGLEEIVCGGITDQYNDVAWVYYHGPSERLALQDDPGFLKLSSIVEKQVQATTIPLSSDVNILPKPDDLIRNMATKRVRSGHTARGGFISRIADMEARRYVAVPARHVPNAQWQNNDWLDIDLNHGICFDGSSLVAAMFGEGFEVETVEYLTDNPVVYREEQIGEFFVSHTHVERSGPLEHRDRRS